MPELPEVETTVRGLKKKVLKRTFLDVWTDFPKIIKKPANLKTFREEIKNEKIEKIFRVGKNIVFQLSDGLFLLIHQKMTGHLLYGVWEKKDKFWQAKNDNPLSRDPMNRFLHLIFFLDNGNQLALSDLRKFAKVLLLNKNGIEKELKSLGPDALKISFEEFKERVKNKKGKIKQVLMNQEVIAGIGNIYSDEILFAAKTHPLKEASKLKNEELKNIYKHLKRILKKAIELKGTSISDYRTIDGTKGGFGRLRKVYQKEGEKCPYCKTLIKRIKISGRSAHFCPKCQKP
jgi:formamidopyrimidine-DNA glycosylase